jgi:hypothetical protein
MRRLLWGLVGGRENIWSDQVARDAGDLRDRDHAPGRHAKPLLDGGKVDAAFIGDGSPKAVFCDEQDHCVTLRHRVVSSANDQLIKDAGDAAGQFCSHLRKTVKQKKKLRSKWNASVKRFTRTMSPHSVRRSVTSFILASPKIDWHDRCYARERAVVLNNYYP